MARVAFIGLGVMGYPMAGHLAAKGHEVAVYNLCTELHATHGVSDAAYAAARDLFGEAGVVELLAISGYYVLVSMVLNVAQVPLPPGEPVPLAR